MKVVSYSSSGRIRKCHIFGPGEAAPAMTLNRPAVGLVISGGVSQTTVRFPNHSDSGRGLCRCACRPGAGPIKPLQGEDSSLDLFPLRAKLRDDLGHVHKLPFPAVLTRATCSSDNTLFHRRLFKIDHSEPMGPIASGLQHHVNDTSDHHLSFQDCGLTSDETECAGGCTGAARIARTLALRVRPSNGLGRNGKLTFWLTISAMSAPDITNTLIPGRSSSR